MKKIIVVFAVVMLAMALLAGCSPTEPDETTGGVSQPTLASSDTQETVPPETGADVTISTAQSSIASQSVVSTKTSASIITLEQAKEIALKDAGAQASEITLERAKLDWNDGIQEYEIEFLFDGWEFEYTIHAGTGHILKYDQKRVGGQNQTQTRSPYSSDTDITLDKAKEIALKHAGLTADQVRFTKAELDYDDGIQEYEIEFFYNGWEYEYTIHAGTGVILEYDWDED